ncbi:prealbumin-like fold domain-containing protein [Anaerosporobacter sp.]|uniref:prealbumin-like fold domain-containing protein n=1 Tax=Anaerosporobacter sp. TaxID=1872529 RepID=UPI00286F2114|nr:prealbumin-like fold domain-containing protein [Anaerosporobacter sp.]
MNSKTNQTSNSTINISSCESSHCCKHCCNCCCNCCCDCCCDCCYPPEPVDVTVTFLSTTIFGDPLEGTEFSLAQNSNFLFSATSGDDGYVNFYHVPDGEYSMIETAVPESFILSDTIYTVIVANGTFSITELTEPYTIATAFRMVCPNPVPAVYYQNAKIVDVEAAFRDIPTTGYSFTLKGNSGTDSISHIQGIGVYHGHYLVSHNHEGNKHGRLITMDNNTFVRRDMQNYNNYNHAGGFQILGDYVLIPLEGDSSSVIQLYDIKNMSAACGRSPEFVKNILTRSDAKAGAVSITHYVNNGIGYYIMAVYDNGKIDFYRSQSDNITTASFSHLRESTLMHGNYSSINLVTSEDNHLYMIGFRMESLNRDYMDLWDLGDGDDNIYTEKISEKHMDSYGVGHFRWGACLELYSTTELRVFATERNFTMRSNFRYYVDVTQFG